MKNALLLVLSSILLITNVLQAQSGKKSVYFPLNECETFDDLSEIMPLFGSEGELEIEVIGYADHLGDDTHNQRLSQCRAESVALYLESALDARITKLNVHGRGELVSAGESMEGDPKNRRVDIVWKLTPSKTPTEQVEVPEIYEEAIEPEVETIAIDTTKKENIVIEGLEFMPGRHYPLPESRPALEKLFNTLKMNPTLEIEIQGFICCDYTVTDGFDNDTQEPFLSRNRAKFVYNYLITEGIDRDRLSYKGYGSTRPKVFPETSPEDQQANRRVEIKVTKF